MGLKVSFVQPRARNDPDQTLNFGALTQQIALFKIFKNKVVILYDS